MSIARKPYEDNERLEFLGDAVLELTVSQFLFKKYPLMSEGELTKLEQQLYVNLHLLSFANELTLEIISCLEKGRR